MLVSPAVRAAQTWAAAAAAVAPKLPPTLDERIYDNTIEALFAVIGEVADGVPTVAVVGHNPSIGELAAALDDGEGDPAGRPRPAQRVPDRRGRGVRLRRTRSPTSRRAGRG